MKIRQGFVSNSSTTVFAIFGTYIENNDDLKEKAEEIGIDAHSDEEGDGFYIGRSTRNMPLDKTLNEIEQELLANFKEIGIDAKKCSWHVEGWRDS